MKIKPFVGLVQAYSEPGVSFDEILITQEVWQSWFDSLNKNIKSQGKMLKYNGFHLVLYICSSVMLKSLEIKGPAKSKRYKTVEYFLWIPYSPVVNDINPLSKLTEYFKQGVREVLEKLEYPEESIEKVLKHITDKPVS